jgi:uncharacterized membrane protein
MAMGEPVLLRFDMLIKNDPEGTNKANVFIAIYQLADHFKIRSTAVKIHEPTQNGVIKHPVGFNTVDVGITAPIDQKALESYLQQRCRPYVHTLRVGPRNGPQTVLVNVR